MHFLKWWKSKGLMLTDFMFLKCFQAQLLSNESSLVVWMVWLAGCALHFVWSCFLPDNTQMKWNVFNSDNAHCLFCEWFMRTVDSLFLVEAQIFNFILRFKWSSIASEMMWLPESLMLSKFMVLHLLSRMLLELN